MGNPIAIGKVDRKVSKDGKKEYFEGWVANAPVKGFWGTQDNNADTLYLMLDVEKAKYLVDKSDSNVSQQAAVKATA